MTPEIPKAYPVADQEGTMNKILEDIVKRNSGPPLKPFLEILEDTYQKGVDDCIKIVELYNTGKELSPLVTTILLKLQNLKSKTP